MARTACLILSIIMGIAIIVLTIIWCVYLGRVAARARETRCAAYLFLSHTTNGVRTDNATFIGINRQLGLIDAGIFAFNGSRNAGPDIVAINNANLNQSAIDLNTRINSFYLTYNPLSYNYPSAINALGTV